jgi:hypothetical protein
MARASSFFSDVLVEIHAGDESLQTYRLSREQKFTFMIHDPRIIVPNVRTFVTSNESWVDMILFTVPQYYSFYVCCNFDYGI